jgi:zinc protease
LVKDKQLASQVQVFADQRIGPSLFYISATPRPGVKPEDLEKGIDEEIAAVVKDGVTAEELAKAKTVLLRRFIEARRSSLRTAVQIGDYAVKFHDPNLINTLVDKERAVTVQEVNEVAKKAFVRDQRTVVVTLPAAKDATAKGGQ